MKNFFLVLAIASCSIQKGNDATFYKYLLNTLGKDFKKAERGEYVLCQSALDLSNPYKTFLVYHSNSNEVVYGPKKLNADIEWESDSELIIREYPETIQNKQDGEKSIYYYNLITGKKYEKINNDY
ncbi:hypothetical protein [Ekhidna sp.]|uniref:hypothetical protein n=1 Tax=Ekhidna sp. TaxID=2608089 RepID=UPI003515D486